MSQDQATSQDPHVARAKQIAEAIDSPDRETTLYEQFTTEFKEWEAEDPTRTMKAFDRAIGRSPGYTQKIVRFVTADDRERDPWAAPGVRERSVTRKTLRERPTEVAEDIAKAMEQPEVRNAVVQHMKPHAAHELHLDARDKGAGNYVPPADRERRQKEADAFSKGQVQPIVDIFTSGDVLALLEQALEELQEVEAINGQTHDRILLLLDQIRTEAEVKRAMEGVR